MSATARRYSEGFKLQVARGRTAGTSRKNGRNSAVRAGCRLWSAGRRTKADAPRGAGNAVLRWFSVQLPCGI
jgi:hypothetical protein